MGLELDPAFKVVGVLPPWGFESGIQINMQTKRLTLLGLELGCPHLLCLAEGRLCVHG